MQNGNKLAPDEPKRPKYRNEQRVDGLSDRLPELKPRTMARLQYGADKYGNTPLLITTKAIVNLRDWKKANQLVSRVVTSNYYAADNQRRRHTPRRDRRRCGALDDPLPAQVATLQTGIIQRAPFVVSYYGNDQAAGLHQPLGTISTRDRHALVVPDILDWYFRMFQPAEVGMGMAFPPSYVVVGNARDQVKQYGNAVTPPVMEWLIRRCIESLYPELAVFDPWAAYRVAA